MSNIGERIKEVRKHPSINLTGEKFAKRIGFSRGGVAGMETGARGVTDQTILAICREFHVSEAWLRTGEGEMFVSSPEADRIRGWIDEILGNEEEAYKARLVSALAGLDDKGWDVIYNLAKKMVAEADEQLKHRTEEEALEEEAERIKQEYINQRKKGFQASSGGDTSTA